MRVLTPNYNTLYCQARYEHVVAYVLDPTKVDIPVLAMALNCSTHTAVQQTMTSDMTFLRVLWNGALKDPKYLDKLRAWEAKQPKSRTVPKTKRPLPSKKVVVGRFCMGRTQSVVKHKKGSTMYRLQAKGFNYAQYLLDVAINLGEGVAWKFYKQKLQPYNEQNMLVDNKKKWNLKQVHQKHTQNNVRFEKVCVIKGL